uniref:Uncharacterized protein n=1 Tax=Parascaris univalens TaxID=6257 RepID=A0A915CGU8_PARUN
MLHATAIRRCRSYDCGENITSKMTNVGKNKQASTMGLLLLWSIIQYDSSSDQPFPLACSLFKNYSSWNKRLECENIWDRREEVRLHESDFSGSAKRGMLSFRSQNSRLVCKSAKIFC